MAEYYFEGPNYRNSGDCRESPTQLTKAKLLFKTVISEYLKVLQLYVLFSELSIQAYIFPTYPTL